MSHISTERSTDCTDELTTGQMGPDHPRLSIRTGPTISQTLTAGWAGDNTALPGIMRTPQTFPTDTRNSLTDNAISASSLSTFRQRLETFPFQASFPDIITDAR